MDRRDKFLKKVKKYKDSKGRIKRRYLGHYRAAYKKYKTGSENIRLARRSSSRDTDIKIGEQSEKVYKITKKEKLTRDQIIERNKALIEKLEKEKQQKRDTSARYREITRIQRSLAQDYNKAVESYNQDIRRAKATVQFASLYPEAKAKEIVGESGVKKYISQKKTKIQDTKKERFVYDKESGVWIDREATSGIMTPAPEKKYSETKNPYKLLFGLDPKTPSKAVLKGELAFRSGVLSEEQIKYSVQGKPLKAFSTATAGTLLGGSRFVVDVVSSPFETVIVGTAKTISDPVGSLFQLGSQFRKDPFGTFGYMGTQGLFFKKGSEAVRSTTKKGLEVYSEYKFEKGRAYETKPFKVDPESSLLYEGQTQLKPKPRAEIIGEITKKETPKVDLTELERETGIKILKDKQKPLKPTETEFKLLESGTVERSDVLKGQEVLRFERATQEAATKKVYRDFEALELEKQAGLKDYGLKEIKPEEISIKVETPKGKVDIQARKGLIIGKKGQTALTPYELFKIGEKAYKKHFERTQKISVQSPKVITDPNTLSGKYTPASVIVPQETGLKTDLTSNQKTDPKIKEPKFETKFYLKPDVDQPAKIEPPRVETRKRTKTGLVIDQTTGQTTGQTTEQIFKPKEPIQTPEYTTTEQIFKPKDPISEDPIIKPPYIKRKRAFSEPRMKRGFDVFIRRKGEFFKATDQPLRQEEALQFGAQRVGRTAAATFKLEQTKSLKLGKFSGSGRLSDFYRKGSLYIEKKEKRIKSIGEKEEITLKGLAALRLGKKQKKILWG